jgi:hypothetical protein
MTEEIADLERTGMWDLVPCPPRVRLITCESIRLRFALMVLLSAIRLILLPTIFSRSTVVIMMRLLLMLLI